MKIKHIIYIVFIIFIIYMFAPNTSRSMNKEFKGCEKLRKDNKFELALFCYDNILEKYKDQTSAQIRFNRALMFLKLERYDEAKIEFEKFLEGNFSKEIKQKAQNNLEIIEKNISIQQDINEYENCEKFRNNKQFEKAFICYNNIQKKYKDKTNTEIIFKRANMLYELKRYDEAKIAYEQIIAGNYDEDFKRFAKNNLEVLNAQIEVDKYNRDLQLDILKAQAQDKGDYFEDLERVFYWQNPKNIKVYIAPGDEKINLLKHAFKKWDEACYSLVDFYYVNNPDEANIIAQTVSHDELLQIDNGNHSDALVGLTVNGGAFSYKNNPSKIYSKKENVYVAKDYKGKKRSDTEYSGVALHEIGHALGIRSHSKAKGDIMYENTSSYMQYNASISNRDVNTIKKMYKNVDRLYN